MTLDLFTKPLIAGLAYQPELIGTTQEQALIACLAELDVAPFRFLGWTGKRKTKSLAGATISTIPASRRPSRFPPGSNPCATAQPPSLMLCLRTSTTS